MPASVVGLIVSEALLLMGCYLLAFRMVSDEDFEIYHLYEGGLERTAVVVASVILGIYFNDLYTDLRVLSRLRLVQQCCLVMGIAFLSQALLSYLERDLIIGRWQMMVGSAIALVMLPLWRIAFDYFVMRVMNRQQVLFVGANNLVQAITRTLAVKPQFGLYSVGYLAAAPLDKPCLGLGEWLGPLDQLKQTCEAQKPALIITGLSERRGQLPMTELLELRMSGAVRIDDVTSLYESVMWRVSVEALKPSQLLFSSELGPNPHSLSLQKWYSFLIALAGMIITLPILLLVWVAVRLSSAGPAIYSQKRVGLKGKVFSVYKFRFMYIDAEARTGAVWAQKNDPRITPLGRWLRKLRLDELPQMFNVLKGEMAIVGPRPERPEFVKVLSEQIPFYGQRHSVLPGITGWAQINHKYGDTVEDTITKLEYDLYYLKHLSLSLDMYIIFHTLKVMVLSRGSQ